MVLGLNLMVNNLLREGGWSLAYVTVDPCLGGVRPSLLSSHGAPGSMWFY